ncbi:MAG: hypothetical protein RLZZ127_1626 [Planctomycetota bacterium]
MVPIGLLLLGATVLAAIAIHGSHHWAAVQKELRAAGAPVSWEDWIATLPPASASAADLRAALAAMPVRDLGMMVDRVAGPGAARFSATTAAVNRRELERALAEQATAATAIRTLLREPGIDLTIRDLYPATTQDAAAMRSSWTPSTGVDMMTAWNLAAHLEALVRLDRSPLEAAADLRRFATACRSVDDLLGAMRAIAIQGRADRVHLDLIVAGRMPETDAAIWIADRADTCALLADGWRGERMWTGAWLEQGPTSTPGLYRWTFMANDLAMHHTTFRWLEIHARNGSGSATAPPMPGHMTAWMYPMSMMTFPNLLESPITALEADAGIRAARAAALLWYGALGQPDASATRAATAIGPLLDAGPGRVRLGWESLGGRRIRVGIDLSSPQPSILDLTSYRRDRCLGAPAGHPRRPGDLDRESIELVLPP